MRTDYVGDSRTYEARVERADLDSVTTRLGRWPRTVTKPGRLDPGGHACARGVPAQRYTIEVANDFDQAITTRGALVAWVASRGQKQLILQR